MEADQYEATCCRPAHPWAFSFRPLLRLPVLKFREAKVLVLNEQHHGNQTSNPQLMNASYRTDKRTSTESRIVSADVTGWGSVVWGCSAALVVAKRMVLTMILRAARQKNAILFFFFFSIPLPYRCKLDG